jgi:hypothetical protein
MTPARAAPQGNGPKRGICVFGVVLVMTRLIRMLRVRMLRVRMLR